MRVEFDSKHFDKVVKSQLDNMKLKGAKFMAERIIEKMEQNVDQGVGFEPGKYQRAYAPRTIKDRKKLGYQTAYADLQRSEKRVKTAYVETNKDFVQIKFAKSLNSKGRDIMFFHHWGKGNNPRRQLFPDIQGGGENSKGTGALENPEVMRDIARKTEEYGAKIMS